MKFFAELRRRNVLPVAGTFLVGSWFLVQIAFTLESVMNLPDWFDSIFMALLILGLPVAIVLAWAFELTPEGFKRTELVNEAESITEKTGKKLDIAILIGLVLIGALLIFTHFRPGGLKAPKYMKVDGRSVAVLPFENRSAEAENAFFADGIHDELLTALAKVPGLDVISRTSVMGYRGTDKRVPEIAEELGAAAILEGAVQKAGPRVRITVQLIDGRDDTHIWANNYDRALTTENIFDIQGEITQVIAESLEDVLAGTTPSEVENQNTQNIKAYEAYIRAKLKTNPGDNKAEELKEALKLYDDAINYDSNYAKAWAGRAYAQMALYWFHGKDTSYRDAAIISLSRAKELGPNNLETHIAEAFYHYWGFSQFPAAEIAFDKALAVAPANVDALAGKAFIVRRLGHFKDAAVDLEQAHRLDPLSYYLIPELGLTYALIGDFDQAKEMMDQALDMDPSSLQGTGFAAAIAQFRGEPEAAHRYFEPLAKYLPMEHVNYALAVGDEGDIRHAISEWPETAKLTPNDQIKFAMAEARVAIALGLDADKRIAIDKLTKAYDTAATWAEGQAYSPVILAGLLGHKDHVARLAGGYDAFNPDDKLRALTDYGNIAEAYIHLGDFEAAMDYIEKMEALTGPHIIRVLEYDPMVAPLRNHPRYQALKARAAP